MFHSAAVRLTLWYLALIMLVSLMFSGLLYRVSSDELERNVNRQVGYFTNFLGPNDFLNYNSLRQRQLDEDRSHLRGSLVLFNVMVLVGGGAASYLLARRTLRPIEDALTSQSRFAADASHELRTPLTAIQTENEVALRNPGLKKDEAVALLKSNLEEVGKLKALSEGLLKLANNSGRVDSPQAVSVSAALEPAISRLSKSASQKRIRINNQAQNLKAMGDQESLAELFYTLLDNAIKYSAAGSPVNIRTSRHHKEIAVAFEDKGKGIKAEGLSRIFERFYQADTSRTKQGQGGYGLGLAIARKITEAHGGHIEVRSTVGKGSTFIVRLPAA